MAGNFDPQPIVIEREFVRLEPLDHRHADDLFEAGKDPSVWEYLTRPAFHDPDDAFSWIGQTLALAETGAEVPFAIVHRESNKAVGSTRFMDIRRRDRALEIGWTWLTPAVQRTAVNTECKYLLLEHAFDVHGANRVCLKTDKLNENSQRAIERIGGMKEGILRQDRITHTGRVRDSVYYSIIDTEWPEVKNKLLHILGVR